MDATQMLAELNDHGFSDESTIAKVRALQHSVWDIEGRLAWTFLEGSATLTFDGTNPYPTNLPDDFRAAVRVQVLDNGNRLRPVRMEELEDLAVGNYVGSGAPQVYYFDGRVLNVWPVPGAGTTAKLRYIKWSSPISDTSAESAFLVPKYFHRLIVYGALWKLYDMEDDPELSSRFEGHYEAGLKQMQEAMWQRQYDQPDHIVMTDPDDWYGDL